MSEMSFASGGYVSDNPADNASAELHPSDVDAEGSVVSSSEEEWDSQLEIENLKREILNLRYQLEQARNSKNSLQKQLQQERTTSSGLRAQLRQARAGNASAGPVIPLNAVYVQTTSLDPTRFEEIKDAIMGDAGITAKKLKNALEKELTSGSDASLKTWKKIKPVAGKGKLVAAFHNDPILSALLPTTISSSTILCWVEARQPGQPAPAPAPIPASAPAVAPAPITYQTAGGLSADGPAPMVGGSASADDPPALYPHQMPIPRRPFSTASMPGVL